MSDSVSPGSSSPSSDDAPNRLRSLLDRLPLTSLAALGGTYAVLRGVRAWQRSRLTPPVALPNAVSGTARSFALPSGRCNVYVRPGTGTPIVLVHSFNAAASSFELKPVYDHFVQSTDRPVYALDWIGFGRSDRRDVDYTRALFDDQLFRFLSEYVDGPSDVVALSLGSEVAARTALQAAPLVRRLALIAPTGITDRRRGPSPFGGAMITAANATGAFELLFYRLTSRASLRSFYERQVFLDATAISDELVDYAYTTSHAVGAHHAPLRFVRGDLFQDDVAESVYARLYRPTLLLTPKNPAPTVQRFDRLPDLLDANQRDLHHTPLPGGLLPHWEAPDSCLAALDGFFE